MEEAREARERAMEIKEAKRRSAARDLYLFPHYDELDATQRKFFKLLCQEPSFDVGSIASKYGISPDIIWERVCELLRANLLLEKCGPLMETRPYSEYEAYENRAMRESRYSVRGVAVRQMHAIEEREKAKRVEPPAPAPARESISNIPASELADFIAARAVTGDVAESEVLSRARYMAWTQAEKREPISVQEWQDALTAAGFELKGGSRQGLWLRTQAEVAA